MRVISGTAKGCRLQEPRDRKIRPTTDKVKESIYNIIQFEVEGSRVLDMFAGTGQLGIEALSRGASEAVFTEASGEAARIVESNLRAARVEDRGRLVRGDCLTSIGRLGKFDIILLDPPYSTGLLEKALARIIEFDNLTADGIIVCELPSEDSLPDLPMPYHIRREYRYGKIKLIVITRGEQP